MPCPRSAFIDGRPYAMVFDRMLSTVRRFVAKQVAVEDSVIDLCCGTGALAIHLATRCQRVVGVDLSPGMIRHARRVAVERGVENTRFELRDATDLRNIGDRTFDLATLVLGLHEMPADLRLAVLGEAIRVSHRALIVDYAVPLPWNWVTMLARISEVACGPRHLSHFLDYMKRGGLDPLLQSTGATIARRGRINRGCLEVVTVAQSKTSISRTKKGGNTASTATTT